jgi:DNA repair exonuclease SbcCD nuclease subunit
MPKFLHAADLHLDSPMRSLDVFGDGAAGRLRNASREALRRMVDCALDQDVAFVVIAGDLFDVAHPSVETTLHLVDQLRRLSQRRIPVFIVRGNHDFHARGSGRLWPEGVHEFSSERAERIVLDDLRVVVHGMSYPTQAVQHDLTPGYAPPTQGHLDIGVLHTALEGYAGEHATYAPVTPAGLAAKGYGYWALGHVHAFMSLQQGPSRIVYPGNLQGRHVREKGRKGVVVVTYEGSAIRAVDHVPCDVVRWHDIHVEPPEGSLSAQLGHVAREIRGKLAEDEADQVDSAVRVRLAGLGAEGEALGPRGRRDRLREALRAECGTRVLLEEVHLAESARLDLPGALADSVAKATRDLLAQPRDGDLAKFTTVLWDRLGAIEASRNGARSVREVLAERLDVEDAASLRRRCIELGAARLAACLAEKT